MRFLKAIVTIVACFSFQTMNVFAFSETQYGASGLSNTTYNAQAGIPSSSTSFSGKGTQPSNSSNGNGVYLSDYSNGQTLSCGGQVFQQGHGGVNLQSGGHVSITNASEFISKYGTAIYNKVINSSDTFVSNGHTIHQYQSGGCSYTIDQSIAPKFMYQYVVYQKVAWNSQKQPSSTAMDVTGNDLSKNYCPYNAQITNGDMKIYPYNKNAFYINTNDPNYILNAGCAGIYDVTIFISTDGGKTFKKQSENKDWEVDPDSLKKTVDIQPYTQQNDNPTPDVWISK